MPVDAAFVRALRNRATIGDFASALELPLGDQEVADELVRQVAKLRRLTAETGLDSLYTDEDLAEYAAETIVTDMTTRLSGNSAVDTRYITTPVTFDLNAAAAKVWEEKLNALIGAGTYDYSADGQSFSLGQLVEQYKNRVAYYTARRRVRSVRLVTKRAAPADRDTLDGRL